jgi:glutamine amidotransferase
LPASEDPFFHEQAQQAVGQTVLAHVRKASVGTISIENTHPFAVEHWLFAHNGTIALPVLNEAEQRIDKELLDWRQGQTDSEAVFLWLLSRLTSFGLDPYQPAPDVQVLVELVGDSFSRLVGWSKELAPDEAPGLNLMLTDGRSMVCSRWNRTLSLKQDDGLAFIASEPVDDGEWSEVPEGSVAWIDADCRTGVVRFL